MNVSTRSSSSDARDRQPSTFSDFELVIDEQAVRAHSPFGHDVHAAKAIASNATELQAIIREFYGLRTQGARDLSPEEDAVAEARSAKVIGTSLFEILFPTNVRVAWATSLELATQGESGGLRLRLRIVEGWLSLVPWELLYDPAENKHLGQWRRTPIVRDFVHAPPSNRVVQIAPGAPLSVLAVAANPKGTAELELDEERKRVVQSLAHLEKTRPVGLDWRVDPTVTQILDALRDETKGYHLFHFAGHGDPGTDGQPGRIGVLMPDGSLDPLSADALGDLLINHESLQLVVLNACHGARADETSVFSSVAATLVSKGIPAVLAMMKPIQDVDAIDLAEWLYQEIARNTPVDVVGNLLRHRLATIKYRDAPAWASPVVLMHGRDGVLFAPTEGHGSEPPVGPPDASSDLGWKRWWRWVVVGAVVIVMATALTTYLVGVWPWTEGKPADPTIFIRTERELDSDVQEDLDGIDAVEDVTERCRSFLYCVHIPGSGSFPVLDQGIRLSTSFPETRDDLVKLTTSVRSCSDVVVLKRIGNDAYGRCDPASFVILETKREEGVHECVIPTIASGLCTLPLP